MRSRCAVMWRWRRLGDGRWERWYRVLIRVLAALVTLLLLNALQLRAVPVLRLAAQAQGNNLASQLASEQTAKCLGDYGGSFVQIERDEEGKILSVGLDAQKANLLKTDLTLQLTQQLQQLEKQKLSIPLGTILGGALLNGRGPGLSFVVEPYGSAQVDFVQELCSAGINQTVYRVQMKVKIQLNTTLAGVTQSAGAQTSFLLEERLIAGEVPQLYAQ